MSSPLANGHAVRAAGCHGLVGAQLDQARTGRAEHERRGLTQAIGERCGVERAEEQSLLHLEELLHAAQVDGQYGLDGFGAHGASGRRDDTPSATVCAL